MFDPVWITRLLSPLRIMPYFLEITMSSLLPNGKQRFVDDSGEALAGGSVYYYEVGTTTYKDTWQDPLG